MSTTTRSGRLELLERDPYVADIARRLADLLQKPYGWQGRDELPMRHDAYCYALTLLGWLRELRRELPIMPPADIHLRYDGTIRLIWDHGPRALAIVVLAPGVAEFTEKGPGRLAEERVITPTRADLEKSLSLLLYGEEPRR